MKTKIYNIIILDACELATGVGTSAMFACEKKAAPGYSAVSRCWENHHAL